MLNDSNTENPQATPQNSDQLKVMSKQIDMLGLTLNQVIKEQRTGRRWKVGLRIVKYVLVMLVIFSVIGSIGQNMESVPNNTGGHIAVVAVKGMIAEGEQANATDLNNALKKAFSNKDSKAIVLLINSGGGSPVQSNYVNNEIYRLKAIYPNKKVYAVITDTGASGAYFIAVAADEIYSDPASIVGSIGVTAAGFGFEGLIGKLGIERRKFTSGEHKGFLDPFSPVNEEESALFAQTLLTVHEQFIAKVKEGRGDRLVENDKMFSGLFWSGEQALELGLIDGFKTLGDISRQYDNAKIVDFTIKRDPLEKFLGNIGARVSMQVISELSNNKTQIQY
ncbi:MAG: S49 family peptidase [Saccharospirillaceae bacterium]|nr:S49 family peptidase [Pseudomonadales bacterium]NRB81250.1 S49 family peptidase [Saccharospirillaceae bacterium]